MSRWFRYYDEALDDPKVQRLSGDLFKTWINLLCLASKSGGKLPSNDDIAFRLRISVQDAQLRTEDLIMAGLIDIGPDRALSMHGWTERQYVSDTSSERVRKHRKNKAETPCNDGETLPKRECNVIESESYSDTDTESPDLPSSLDAARAKGRNDQRGLNKFGGRRQDGRHEKIIRRAEGLGVPVDDLTERLNQQKVKNRSAYFTTLCVEWFETRLPGIDEDVIRSALWGTEKQYAAVMNLMVNAP